MTPKHLSAAITLLCLALPVPAFAQGAPAPGLIASCESCHGRNGATATPQTPRLNAQTPAYLRARLRDLRNPGNQTVSAIHNMLGPARTVTAASLEALVTHFAAEPPTAPNHTEANRALGARLYASGAGPQIPGCAGCHGDRGQGIGEAPRLAGQHAAYLQDQMEALMLTARVQNTMNKHAWALTPDQIKALANFLAND